MSLPKVYISILNWNGSEQTIRCLHSLEALDYPNYQVIVVDNASADDSVDRIHAEFPDVQLIRSDTNRGYAGGNELALKEAQLDPQAELFWILNNDAIVQPDTLTALVEAYQQHSEALYGSVPLIDSGENGRWYTYLHYWEIAENGEYIYRKIQNVYFDDIFTSTQARYVGNLSGSSLLLPMSVVKKYGFIDTSFFMYMEDADYCFRLGRLGIKSILVPNSQIFHDGGGSRANQPRVKPVILYYQVRNRLIFRRKYLGMVTYLTSIPEHLLYAMGWVISYLTGNSQGLRSASYTLVGIRDALLNRTGKVFAPENEWMKTSD